MARLWIRLVSVLVPGRERELWVEEWHAELFAAGGGMRHAWGALPDAWTLRTEGWTMDGMLRDVRAAVKGLARRPFFTALAGITLAIGIGANTAIFSVVDAVLINPLPYPQSDRIVSANFTAPGLNLPVVPHSEGMYLSLEKGFRTLSAFAVFDEASVNLLTDGAPQRIAGARVTQHFFDVMGVAPVLGRAFVDGEDREGAEPTAVLGYGLWRQSFGADPGVVGRLVDIEGVQRRVVGVMPEGFAFPTDAEIWMPLPIDEASPTISNLSYVGIGRLADGVTLAAARSEMQELFYRFADANPEEMPRQILDQAGFTQDMKPLKDLYVSDVRQALWVLLGTVGFVLLIACANVANLFLVRAEARQREQALRTALGATRADLGRQYLAESMSLSVGAGALGLLLAWLGVRGLVALAPTAVPRLSEIGIDGSVLAFTAAISVASGVLFGLFPLMGAGRGLSGALREGGRGTTGRPRHRLRSGLVVAQVALALVLLVGSGLMARSFQALRNVDPGFKAENRLSFRISLPAAEYPDAATSRTLYRQLTDRMAAIPGVQEAALITAVPLVDQKNASPMEADDKPTPDGQLAQLVNRRSISPGYFEAMGIDLVEGRGLTWDDAGDGVRAAIINEGLARTLWPEGNVLGRRIRGQGDVDLGWEVVGVAPDVRFERLEGEPEPLIYVPMISGAAEDPSPTLSFDVVLHVGSNPLAFVAPAREALRDVDPRLPIVNPRTMATVVRNAMASTSFTVLLLGIAAAIALVLGTVGIYGVISYVVSQRTQEIGVRMALGAPAGAVLRQVVGQGVGLAGIGVAVGLVGAWAVSRALSSLLFGVQATDPLTYLSMAGALTLVAVLASWIPARRAARVNPTEALRAE